MKLDTREMLLHYAGKYESPDFLVDDPSWFMHQVGGVANQEAMAFLASCLSYGSRRQFMPKIQWIMDVSGGEVDDWVRSGRFEHHLRCGDTSCFYRLYTCAMMNRFLRAYRQLMLEHGSLGQFVSAHASDGLQAIACICRFFAAHDISGIIPKDTSSACKRVCMFLRWMVRDGSPVDLGLWAGFIDRRTLVVPLDTHVLRQSRLLGLVSTKTATMATARRISEALAEVFPDDPLKGDFALFGYGINHRSTT